MGKTEFLNNVNIKRKTIKTNIIDERFFIVFDKQFSNIFPER